VVTIFAVEEYRDTPIIVMELVAGCTLRECIRRARQLDPIEALRISSQVAAGLAAAHAQGVIHRDVKPGNILLEDKLGRVKLTDFGVARAALDNVDLTTQGVVVGTPAYMAPEQVRGEKVDVRADLFALGCVMYSMFTGRSPFHAGSCWEAAHRVTEFEPPPLHEKDPAVPAFLSEIIVRLLKKQPEERFQSAAEVAELLQRHLMLINQAPSDELDAVLHGRRQPEESPLSKRRPVAWVVAGIAALLLLPVLATVVIGYWLHGDSQTPAPKPSGVAVKGSTRERVPRTISVAKDGSGDVQTIAEALGRATPGTLIRVQDDAVYEEAVGIEGADRFAGVNLVSDSGATLAAPASGAFAVLFIKNAPRVTVRGFQIRPAASGHGVAILGACPGVRLESCRVAASSAEHWALIYVTEDAAGTTEQPIVVQAATVEAQTLGIVIQGAETGQAVAHVQVRNSRFAGPGQHVQLNRFVDDVSLVGNTFLGGTAVICNLNATSAAGKVTITNNTFFENGCWLGFGQTSLEGHHLAVRNNLIVGAKGMQAGVHAAADFTHAWSFSHNLWEPATDSDPAVVALVATPVPAVRLVSREAGQLDFLRPTADSQAATSGAGGDLPSYVGAFPPVSSR
jgi:hypothetical protein